MNIYTLYKVQNRSESKKGFTLVEMLVSMALFTIILTIALGALLMVIKANQQAKAIKLVVNNLNLAIEGMSRELRVGTNICVNKIGTNCNTPENSKGSDIIYYTTDKGEPLASYTINNNRIMWCDANCDQLNDYLPLTGSDVFVEDLRFYVRGAPVGDDRQPSVLIAINGYTRQADQLIELDIQTFVSQRKLQF